MPNLDLRQNNKKPNPTLPPRKDEISEIKKLIQTQNEYLKEIYNNTQKTRKYILLGRIISLIYILLIVVPIIFAIIYLPPLIEQSIKPYQELLQDSGLKGGINLENLIKSYK